MLTKSLWLAQEGSHSLESDVSGVGEQMHPTSQDPNLTR